MEIVSDLIKIILPAGLVLLGIYLTIEALMKKQLERGWLEIRSKNTELILPIRLQAYERMTLFLERMAPQNLILRVNQPDITADQLQAIMLREIREEFNHNLSQQIYLSEVAWTLIRNAMEDTLSLINTSAQQIEGNRPSVELARQILRNQMDKGRDPSADALSAMKSEVQVYF
jgi:hypothetical protein